MIKIDKARLGDPFIPGSIDVMSDILFIVIAVSDFDDKKPLTPQNSRRRFVLFHNRIIWL